MFHVKHCQKSWRYPALLWCSWIAYHATMMKQRTNWKFRPAGTSYIYNKKTNTGKKRFNLNK